MKQFMISTVIYYNSCFVRRTTAEEEERMILQEKMFLCHFLKKSFGYRIFFRKQCGKISEKVCVYCDLRMDSGSIFVCAGWIPCTYSMKSRLCRRMKAIVAFSS